MSPEEKVVYLSDPVCLERRLKLEAIFNSVSDGILSVDGDLRVTSFNRAAERIVGVAAADAVGSALSDLFQTRGHDLSCVLNEVIREGRRIEEQEATLALRDGSERWIILNADPLTDVEGEPAGAVLVFRDISEIRQLREELKGRYRFHALVGKSRRMREIYELVEQTAATNATVLIEGESGAGKELVAHAIHYSSPRADGPFVKVNCSALPETLLESELFGHVKGAYTGAISDRMGRFEAADGGTIFLDEIGDVSPLVQLKLLRVLQEREFERVGSRKTVRVDVRVVAATNRDLKQLVREGRFREDLYYRLRVVPVALPPLRERKDDIPMLVAHFVEKFNKEMDRHLLGPTEEATAAVLDYTWPGNVRELENAVEHAFVRCRGSRFGVEDLPQELWPVEKAAERLSIPDDPGQEKALILQVLEEAGGNRTKAARMLGMSRTTLWKRLNAYGIS